MKIQKKWFAALGITIFINFASPTILNGMQNERTDKFFEYFKGLPRELQCNIIRLSYLVENPLTFLSLRLLPSFSAKANEDPRDIVQLLACTDTVVVTAARDQTIKLWSINEDQFQLLDTSSIGNQEEIVSIAVSGDRLIAASKNGTINLWNIGNGQFRLLDTASIKVHSWSDLLMAINDDNKVVISPYGLIVQLWDISNDQFQLLDTTPEQVGSGIFSLALSGNRMVTGSWHKAKLWDISNGRFTLLARTPHYMWGEGHKNEIKSIVITGNRIVTGSKDKKAKLWDITNDQFQLMATTPTEMDGGHADTVDKIDISGNRVVTRSWDATVKLWYISNGKFQLIVTMLPSVSRSPLRDEIDCEYFFSSVAINENKVVMGLSNGNIKAWSLLPMLEGTSKDNPLLGIRLCTDVSQIDFMRRAHGATVVNKNLMISLPEKLNEIKPNESQAQKDGRIYFTFPEHVRKCLRENFSLKFCPHSNDACVIQ